MDGYRPLKQSKRRSLKVLNEQNNVDRIIDLLNEKNNHLQMFHDISEKERKSFKARNFENLSALYEIREDILENIKTIDEKIENYSTTMGESGLTDAEKNHIKLCLEKKEKIVSKILEQDLMILSCVDNEKSSMIKEMSSMRSSRRLLKAYRTLPDIID